MISNLTRQCILPSWNVLKCIMLHLPYNLYNAEFHGQLHTLHNPDNTVFCIHISLLPNFYVLLT